MGVIVEDIRSDIPDAQIIIAGDFNAKSLTWGERHHNAKGGSLVEWTSGLGLKILNDPRGRVSTCVQSQGESIVDITMALCAVLPE